MADDEGLYPALDVARTATTRAPDPRRSAKVRFRLDKFNNLVETHGQRLLWQQAIPCACRLNTQTDQPNPICTICRGSGYEYFDPREIRGIIQNIAGDYQIFPGSGARQGYAIVESFGEWFTGQAILTVRPETPVGFRDRITMLDAAIEFSEIVERTTAKAAATSSSPGDPVFRLRYRIVPRVVEVFDIEQKANIRITERVIRLRVWTAAGETRVLREGADFDVLPDGTLDLTKGDLRGTGPAVGDRFAIKYVIQPPWIVYDLRPQYFRRARDENQPTEEDLLPYPRSIGIGIDFLVTPQDEGAAGVPT